MNFFRISVDSVPTNWKQTCPSTSDDIKANQLSDLMSKMFEDLSAFIYAIIAKKIETTTRYTSLEFSPMLCGLLLRA